MSCSPHALALVVPPANSPCRATPQSVQDKFGRALEELTEDRNRLAARNEDLAAQLTHVSSQREELIVYRQDLDNKLQCVVARPRLPLCVLSPTHLLCHNVADTCMLVCSMPRSGRRLGPHSSPRRSVTKSGGCRS